MEIIDNDIEKVWGDFVNDFKQLIEFKSVTASATQTGIISFLEERLQALLEADVTILYSEHGNPTIWAHLSGKVKRGIIMYGHYDVMPTNENEWRTPPFELSMADKRFWGRGTGDNKGQLLIQIYGLLLYRHRYGQLPYDVELVLEGNEEQGSLTLSQHLHEIQNIYPNKIIAACVFDGSYQSDGSHVLRLGNRGVLGFELRITTSSQSHHSGNFGGTIRNPNEILQILLSKMYDPTHKRVLLPHFYDGMQKITPQERQWLNQLPFEASQIQALSDVTLLSHTVADYYERLMFQPTFNISGLKSGYVDDGIKTIIPNETVVKIDCRLVPGQNIAQIILDIEKMITSFQQPGVEIGCQVLVKTPPYKLNVVKNQMLLTIMTNAIKQATGQVLIEPIMPGTVPNAVWDEIDVPAFTMPLGNFDQNNHANDENLTFDAVRSGMKIIYLIMTNLGEIENENHCS